MSPMKRQYLLQLAGLVAAFLVLELAAGKLLARASLPYILSVLSYVLPALPLFAIVPLANAYGKNNPDSALSARRAAPVRRYMARMGLSMFFYVIILMASVAALNRFELSLQIKTILAIFTALPIGGVIWAIASLIADPDTDEFERMIMAKSTLLSTAMILFFSALWGFLENFAEAPDFPLYLLIPVFFGLFGLTQPFVRRGYK